MKAMELQPPFNLPAGVTFDGVADFLGRKLLMFTDASVTKSSFGLKPAEASAERLASRVATLRADFGKEAA